MPVIESHIACGVPQGSIVDPVLFSIYIIPFDQIMYHNLSFHWCKDNTESSLILSVFNPTKRVSSLGPLWMNMKPADRNFRGLVWLILALNTHENSCPGLIPPKIISRIKSVNFFLFFLLSQGLTATSSLTPPTSECFSSSSWWL